MKIYNKILLVLFAISSNVAFSQDNIYVREVNKDVVHNHKGIDYPLIKGSCVQVKGPITVNGRLKYNGDIIIGDDILSTDQLNCTNYRTQVGVDSSFLYRAKMIKDSIVILDDSLVIFNTLANNRNGDIKLYVDSDFTPKAFVYYESRDTMNLKDLGVTDTSLITLVPPKEELAIYIPVNGIRRLTSPKITPTIQDPAAADDDERRISSTLIPIIIVIFVLITLTTLLCIWYVRKTKTMNGKSVSIGKKDVKDTSAVDKDVKRINKKLGKHLSAINKNSEKIINCLTQRNWKWKDRENIDKCIKSYGEKLTILNDLLSDSNLQVVKTDVLIDILCRVGIEIDGSCINLKWFEDNLKHSDNAESICEKIKKQIQSAQNLIDAIKEAMYHCECDNVDAQTEDADQTTQDVESSLDDINQQKSDDVDDNENWHAKYNKCQNLLEAEKTRADRAESQLETEKTRVEEAKSQLEKEKTRTEEAKSQLEKEKTRADATEAKLEFANTQIAELTNEIASFNEYLVGAVDSKSYCSGIMKLLELANDIINSANLLLESNISDKYFVYKSVALFVSRTNKIDLVGFYSDVAMIAKTGFIVKNTSLSTYNQSMSVEEIESITKNYFFANYLKTYIDALTVLNESCIGLQYLLDDVSESDVEVFVEYRDKLTSVTHDIGISVISAKVFDTVGVNIDLLATEVDAGIDKHGVILEIENCKVSLLGGSPNPERIRVKVQK